MTIIKQLQLISLCCVFFMAFLSCVDKKNNEEKQIDALTTKHRATVVYQQNFCCQNLRALTEITLPEFCEGTHSVLFALNLDAFNIPQNYEFGDTLSIVFNFTEDCEAQGEGFDCVTDCDTRHGVPIEIIAVD